VSVSLEPLIINDELILVHKFIPRMLHFRALNICWSVLCSQAVESQGWQVEKCF